jgi:hypothetical protein
VKVPGARMDELIGEMLAANPAAYLVGDIPTVRARTRHPIENIIIRDEVEEPTFDEENGERY